MPRNPPTVGSYPLVVTYTPADTIYAIAYAMVTLVVNKATPVISWTPAAMTYGSALDKNQLTITVSNPNNGASVAGSFAYTPTLVSLDTTPLTVGTHPLSVNFTPTDNTDYVPAAKTVVITVNRAPSAIMLYTWNPSADAGQNVTLTAVVLHLAAGIPSGAVQFSDGATVVATMNLNANGNASWSTSSPSVGTNVITATYAGDQNFIGSNGSFTQQIGPEVSR